MLTTELESSWNTIRELVLRGQASSLYCSIATVGKNGEPNITPIGTVFLRSDQTGFFFDCYTSLLATNLSANNRICLLAVNSGKAFWLRSLFRGRFSSAPGVRLYGTASALRLASSEERAQVDLRVRKTRWLKGSRMLWSDFTHVRDLTFTSFRPVSYPVMMDGMWPNDT
jgi:uncharacterized protein